MSERIQLLHGSKEVLEQVLEGDEALNKYLELEVPEHWSTFGMPSFRFALDQVTKDPENARWWTYLTLFPEEEALVGSCGYHGPPSPEGEVEIGYEIASGFQNRGLATESAELLIEMAFNEPGIRTIRAHTLAEENASVKVLRKCGFTLWGEVPDKEEGIIWRWTLDRPV